MRAQTDYQRYLSKAAYLTLSANVVMPASHARHTQPRFCTTEQLIELESQQLHLTEVQVRAGTAPMRMCSAYAA